MSVEPSGKARLLWCSAVGNHASLDARHPSSRIGRARPLLTVLVLYGSPCSHGCRVPDDPESPADSVGMVFCEIYHADKRQVAVVLIEVKSIAENKSVRNCESSVVDWNDGFTTFSLVEQSTHAQTGRLARFEHAEH